jgi:hypothetical protein
VVQERNQWRQLVKQQWNFSFEKEQNFLATRGTISSCKRVVVCGVMCKVISIININLSFKTESNFSDNICASHHILIPGVSIERVQERMIEVFATSSVKEHHGTLKLF